jgi:hypothetical protein
MMEKLKLSLINIGDLVEYLHEGQRVQARVHGWHLAANGYDHHAIVGSARHEFEIPLRSILSRHRDKGAERGTVTF